MNVYDFDDTILEGDTEVYFFKYINDKLLLKRFKLKKFNKLLADRVISEEVYRANTNKIYKMIALYVKKLESVIEEFWDEHEHFVKPLYNKIRKDDDIITTATPSFLVLPIFKRINIKNYVATEFNFEKLCFDQGFNYGEDKPVKFREKFGNVEIDKFYSDSESDIYMAKIAKKPIKVIGENCVIWKL